VLARFAPLQKLTHSIFFAQRQFYDIHVPPNLLACLCVICFGVTVSTVSDVSMNFLGTFWAVMGLVSTAFYQLLVKSRQEVSERSELALRMTRNTHEPLRN
jgi:hypothetical protein